MKCRECGLELDERDLTRSGAYQCPECGTVNHTASSTRKSPSPWRRRRKRRYGGGIGDMATRRLWVLPMWAWAVIVLLVIAAVIVAVTLGRPHSSEDTDMPAVLDVPVTESQVTDDEPAGEDGGSGANDADNAIVEPTDAPVVETVESNGHTGVSADNLVVSFDWAMNYLKYESTLNLVSEDTNAAGEVVQSYRFEDWLDVSLTLDTATSNIRAATATASMTEPEAPSPTEAATETEGEAGTEGAGETPAVSSEKRMKDAFVSLLYAFDTSLTAGSASREVEGMLQDSMRTYGTSSMVAKISKGEFSGYTLEVGGKL